MASLLSFLSPLSTTRTSIQVHAKGGCNLKLARFPRLRPSRFRVSCSAASAETVQKVCDIVKKQLALSDDKVVTAESQFSELGADSLDTVEIVMSLEEEFGITVEEDNSQSITTVQEAANLIQKLVETKA